MRSAELEGRELFMKKRYIFWPFETRQSMDLDGDLHGIRETMDDFKREGSAISYVRYGSRKHRGRLTHCNDTNKTIYVTGHGAPGHHFIYPDPNGDGESLHALLLVGRLMEYGLRSSTRCKLKIFTCNSSSDNKDIVSFAEVVALVLRQCKFNDIRVFGYNGKVAPKELDANNTYFIGTHPKNGIYGVWKNASEIRDEFL